MRTAPVYASLVILSYNRKEYLERSLRSLFLNTRFPHQIIIMDDGSDEETQDYIYSLVKDGRISTALFNTQQRNLGLGIAVNRGFEIAGGDYLLKLDSDLEYEPGWLTEVVRLLDTYHTIGCLGLFKYWHEPCNFPSELVEEHRDHYRVIDFVGSALCMRREIYTTVGRWMEFNRCFAEDVDFKDRVKDKGYWMALPKKDLATNFGFGEQHSSLIKTIDWEGGKHEYNIPGRDPVLFGG